MDILQIISAAGLGGIIGSLLVAWLNYKINISSRNFKEKKEAYIGFLHSYAEAGLKGQKTSVKEKQNFGYWIIRCSLVANKKIINQLENMKTNNHEEQRRAFEKALDLMKKDLGIELQ